MQLFVPQLINCNRLRIGQREFIIISIDILHMKMAYQAAVSSFCSIRKRLSSLNVLGFLPFLVGVNKLGWQFEYTDTVPVAYSIASQRHPRQEYAR